MPRKSRIAQLPPEIKAEVDRLIRGGRATIDDIVAHLRRMDVDDVSRSSVGRYKQSMEERLAKYREAQEVAGKWVAALGEQPDSQTGQLLAELLKTVAFGTLAELQDEGRADPGDLMLLARSLKDMAAAQKTDMEFRKQLRAAWQAEMEAKARAAEEEVASVAKSAGLTPDAERRIREIVLGVVA